MTAQLIKRAIKRAIKTGNWMIRADHEGKSYGGFQWAPLGEWTEAPDWNPDPVCGGGLHGQDSQHGGYIRGSRLVFCETDGDHVVIRDGNIKCKRARILIINELPAGLHVGGDLDLRNTQITELPAGLHVGGGLWLSDTQITTLPAGLHVGGDLDLRDTQITELPAGLHVGGGLWLSHTQITTLPAGLHVGGVLDLSNTQN